jgi:hypothetical protein
MGVWELPLIRSRMLGNEQREDQGLRHEGESRRYNDGRRISLIIDYGAAPRHDSSGWKSLQICTGSDQTTLVTVIANIVCKLVMWWIFSERKILKLLLFGSSSAPKLRVKKCSSFDECGGEEKRPTYLLEDEKAHWRRDGANGCTWIELR